MFFIFLF